MRRFLLPVFLIIASVSGFSQISGDQPRALNAFVDYSNASADEVTRVVRAVMDYYPSLSRKNSGYARFSCGYELDDYFEKNVASQRTKLSKDLLMIIDPAYRKFQDASAKVEGVCKAFDTYHKLEDYKRDNFAGARTMINDIISALNEYRVTQEQFASSLESAFKKLKTASQPEYERTRVKMLDALQKEKAVINLWAFNLEQQTHSGWPVEAVKNGIPETQKTISFFQSTKPTLKYPASTTWGQFQEGLSSMVSIKQNGVDGYNFEAKKSDAHSNGVYLDLINYFNGTLVSFHNSFIDFSQRDGYFGLKTMKIVPAIVIRSEAVSQPVQIKSFGDFPHVVLNVPTSNSSISKNAFKALTEYVELINETWRQTGYLQSVLENFKSTVNSFKRNPAFDKRAPMHFDFPDYKIPHSIHQQTIQYSKDLSPSIAAPLNQQAQVLINILTELNDICAYTEQYVTSRQYEKEAFKKLDELFERESTLFNIWNERKELFYNDIRTAFDSFKPAMPTSNWYLSGIALRDLVRLDHDAVFAARAFYTGDTTQRVSTANIDATVRDVISKEYTNMKGIERLGRSNGNCPYTPYEDVPETSRLLSEKLQKLTPPTAKQYRHPYHDIVYLYNEIVEDYNSFCELSKDVPHLKSIKQPELFILPSDETKASGNTSLQNSSSQSSTSENKRNNGPTTRNNVSSTRTTVIHDTVYIEKRDTIYLPGKNEDPRSMEGYAINNLILLLDVSGSMDQPEKLPVLKKAVLDLLSMMRAEDRISIITFSGKPKILLSSVSFKEEKKITKAIDALTSSGKTDANAALELAYKVADENYIRGGSNRIVLATDGEFILNDDVKNSIQRFASQDVFLTVFNFGKGMGSSKMLQSLASLGKGNYETIAKENVDLKLIREVKAKRR